MTDFYDVLFEVSNEVRHSILEMLVDSERVVTHVAERLGISMTEASRHFNRLSEAGLIETTPAGHYRLTATGALCLRQLVSLRFTMEHLGYFKDRDLSRLPSMFVNRLDELSSSNPNYTNKANIMNTARNMTRVFSESKKEVLYILDEEITKLILYPKPEANAIEKYRNQIKKGVSLKFLFPETFDMDRVHPDMVEMNRELSKTGRWESRLIDRCDVFIHMSEREVAVLSFSDRDGYYDYLGFEGTDKETLGWCMDVFNYYWNRSRPVSVF